MQHPVGYAINHKTGKPQLTYYVFRQRLGPGDFRPPALLTRQGPLAKPDGRTPRAGKPSPAGPARAAGPEGLG